MTKSQWLVISIWYKELVWYSATITSLDTLTSTLSSLQHSHYNTFTSTPFLQHSHFNTLTSTPFLQHSPLASKLPRVVDSKPSDYYDVCSKGHFRTYHHEYLGNLQCHPFYERSKEKEVTRATVECSRNPDEPGYSGDKVQGQDHLDSGDVLFGLLLRDVEQASGVGAAKRKRDDHACHIHVVQPSKITAERK